MKGMSRGWRSGPEERCRGFFYFWISNGEKNPLKTNPAPKPPLLPHGGGAMVVWAGSEVIRGSSGKVCRHQADRPPGGGRRYLSTSVPRLCSFSLIFVFQVKDLKGHLLLTD